jgi:flavin reductase (DIM6/NTAB) family NADH-FMN oxidoreductase RutF
MSEKMNLSSQFILAPVPVVLVACAHEELGRNLLTVAWCGVSCSDPEMISVAIRPGRHSYGIIKESGVFTVNLPWRGMVRAVDLCGAVSGRDGDKFERAGLTAAAADVVAAPLVAECPVNLECRVKEILPLGAHHLFIGEVVAKHADARFVDGGGIDFGRIGLITYVKGEYWSLGEVIERAGFSMRGD